MKLLLLLCTSKKNISKVSIFYYTATCHSANKKGVLKLYNLQYSFNWLFPIFDSDVIKMVFFDYGSNQVLPHMQHITKVHFLNSSDYIIMAKDYMIMVDLN